MGQYGPMWHLALVGWYLMLAPACYDEGEAVLTVWRIVGSFDTAEACEAARHQRDMDAARTVTPPTTYRVRR
jgi:hypothetical protein